METGGSAKSVTGPVATVPRADMVASYMAVPTESPPEETVQQVSPIQVVRLELSDGYRECAILDKILNRALQRSTNIDGPMKTVVHQVTNEATGEVVDQFPAEHILKLRAYLRDEANAKRDGGRIT